MKNTKNKTSHLFSKVGQRRQVVIPQKISKAVGLEEGGYVEIWQNDKEIILRPKILADQEETLSSGEEKIAVRGFTQLKRGQFISWKDLKRDLGN